MKNTILKFSAVAAVVLLAACAKVRLFPDTVSDEVPQLKEAAAQFLWIGPEYKLALQAKLEDGEGISKVRIKNGEWEIDSVLTVNNQQSFTINDTFLVVKDVNATKHIVELIITNSKGGVVKTNVNVEDLSAENQIPGYSPDLVPPAITVTKPTVTKYLGFSNDAINLDVEADIKDAKITSVEVKVWGETAAGEPLLVEDVKKPANADEEKNFKYARTFSLPAGKVGEYQYVVRSTDAAGNKSVKGGTITVGYIDRLYLSDAETEAEVLNQGFDHYGNARGIGTLLSMKKQGANTFEADFYYRNEAADNIRFVAFLGTDMPFITNQSKVNYTLAGPNVVAMSATESGKITTSLAAAGFKLPVSQKGYYKVTVDMTARTVKVTSFTPPAPADATKYPGWTAANPWAYLAVTGASVVGTAGWTEVATSPKLNKEANHAYLYTGTFKTQGNSENISFNAPTAANSDVWGKGWFRMTAARANMKDDYGSLITKVGPVGASGGGANWGFSLAQAGTFKVTYDIVLQRMRAVRTGN